MSNSSLKDCVKEITEDGRSGGAPNMEAVIPAGFAAAAAVWGSFLRDPVEGMRVEELEVVHESTVAEVGQTQRRQDWWIPVRGKASTDETACSPTDPNTPSTQRDSVGPASSSSTSMSSTSAYGASGASAVTPVRRLKHSRRTTVSDTPYHPPRIPATALPTPTPTTLQTLPAPATAKTPERPVPKNDWGIEIIPPHRLEDLDNLCSEVKSLRAVRENTNRICEEKGFKDKKGNPDNPLKSLILCCEGVLKFDAMLTDNLRTIAAINRTDSIKDNKIAENIIVETGQPIVTMFGSIDVAIRRQVHIYMQPKLYEAFEESKFPSYLQQQVKFVEKELGKPYEMKLLKDEMELFDTVCPKTTGDAIYIAKQLGLSLGDERLQPGGIFAKDLRTLRSVLEKRVKSIEIHEKEERIGRSQYRRPSEGLQLNPNGINFPMHVVKATYTVLCCFMKWANYPDDDCDPLRS
eukprot:GHVO01064164.1.p1 GENE.GHVO01064164.1~~GHVO01064164.1.p1  ORF type:complete len:464 (+),score=67.24 GHVO01064164.1:39-1430(+)